MVLVYYNVTLIELYMTLISYNLTRIFSYCICGNICAKVYILGIFFASLVVNLKKEYLQKYSQFNQMPVDLNPLDQ